jgi:hypothetical protein
MAVASIFFLITFGLCGLLWGDSTHKRASDWGSVGLGLWSWISAFIIFLVEFFFGAKTPLLQVCRRCVRCEVCRRCVHRSASGASVGPCLFPLL